MEKYFNSPIIFYMNLVEGLLFIIAILLLAILFVLYGDWFEKSEHSPSVFHFWLFLFFGLVMCTVVIAGIVYAFTGIPIKL